MAKKHDILYVNFYTSGSAARKIELTPPQPYQPDPVPEPQAKPQKRQVVYVDPLAIASIAVSVVMLVLMFVGMATLQEAHAQQTRMEDYVRTLQLRNEELQAEFDEKYDPAAVEEMALALGMVPVDQVEHKTIVVEPMEEIPEEPTFWEQVQAFFEDLLA